MEQAPDYYALMGVEPDADEAAIRLAFRRLAWRYHPDVVGPGSLERMQQLNIAYQTLSDPARRREYDLRRGIGVRAPPSTPPAPPKAPASTPLHPQSAPSQPRSAPPRTGPREGSVSASDGPLRRWATLDVGEDTPLSAVALARGGALAGLGLLDGRVMLWETRPARRLTSLLLERNQGAGVLQEVRFSQSGGIIAAWGFLFGLRVWATANGQTLWNTGVNGPDSALDVALNDAPALAGLALPDAPLALASDDPLRWTHEGQGGTALYARPLVGPVGAAWANPVRVTETPPGGRASEAAPWRIQLRTLARDGRRLLTLASGAARNLPAARALSLWDLEARTLFGATQPRRLAQIVEDADDLRFPFAATPDLAWVALGYRGVGARLFSLSAPRRPQRFEIPCGPLPQDAHAALSPDGGLLALAQGDRLDLWATREARALQQFRFASDITALAFAPDAAQPTLAAGLRNGVAELWGA